MKITRFDRIAWLVIAALIVMIGMLVFINHLISRRQSDVTFKLEAEAARLAEVVYMSPANDQAALWRTAAGTGAIQLSAPGQRIFDSAPSPDGETVVYSEWNDLGGMDLWRTDRNGKQSEILVNCQRDQCSSPAWSADQKALAFTRLTRSESNDGAAGISQIWVYGIESREANPFFPVNSEAQLYPSWSPDGKRLAFFEPSTKMIRVIDLLGGQEMQLPSNEGLVGSWSPDGSQMLFTNADVTAEGRPFNKIYLASFSNRQLDVLSDDDQNQMDYSLPVWSPDGAWMVYASSLSGMGAAKQLWMVRIDGSDARQITEENQYTHAAYHWDARGERLVYQRFEQGKGGAAPEIMIWNLDSGQTELVARDAFMPGWLP